MGNFKAFFKLLRSVVCFLFFIGGFSLSAQDIGVTDVIINEGTIDSSAASKTFNLCSTETVTLNIVIQNFGATTENIGNYDVFLRINGVNTLNGGTTSTLVSITASPINLAAGATHTLTYPNDFSGGPPAFNFSNSSNSSFEHSFNFAPVCSLEEKEVNLFSIAN